MVSPGFTPSSRPKASSTRAAPCTWQAVPVQTWITVSPRGFSENALKKVAMW